jgi:asparagine synthase (glutamine-hydrolysing)
MAHGLEVRVPLIDHRLVEFVLSIPDELKIQGKKTKYLLKKCSQKYLPEKTINKQKHGFLLPVGDWLRNELKKFAEEKIFNKNSVAHCYFDVDFLNKLWTIHQSNSKFSVDLSLHLWAVIIFVLWHEKFIE